MSLREQLESIAFEFASRREGHERVPATKAAMALMRDQTEVSQTEALYMWRDAVLKAKRSVEAF